MANQMTTFDPFYGKSYKTEANLLKAIKDEPNKDHHGDPIRYFITWNEEGRCAPIFVGRSAISAGIHHRWPVVG